MASARYGTRHGGFKFVLHTKQMCARMLAVHAASVMSLLVSKCDLPTNFLVGCLPGSIRFLGGRDSVVFDLVLELRDSKGQSAAM